MKGKVLVAVVLLFSLLPAVSSKVAPGPPNDFSLARTNPWVQIPQIIKAGIKATIEFGDLLYSENGISVIAAETKTLTPGDNLKTYYVDFAASQLSPEACTILIYPPPVIDEFVPKGPAPKELKAILGLEVPSLNSRLFTENLALRHASSGDVLRQFAIWAYMGVDLPSAKSYWLSLGLSENAWREVEAWLASFAKASPAENLVKLSPEVEARFEPLGYERVILSLTNRGKSNVFIKIEVGTVLRNADQAKQDLALGETFVALLPPSSTKRARLKSYCMDADKGVPARSDLLTPSPAYDFRVKRLLSSTQAEVAAGSVSQALVQEAVWYLTNARTVSPRAEELLTNALEQKTWWEVEADPWEWKGSNPVGPALAASLASGVLFLALRRWRG